MFAMYSGACFAASQCFRFICGLPAHLSKFCRQTRLAGSWTSQPAPAYARLTAHPATLHYNCPPAASSGPDVQHTSRSLCGRAAWSPSGSVTPADLHLQTGECEAIKVRAEWQFRPALIGQLATLGHGCVSQRMARRRNMAQALRSAARHAAVMPDTSLWDTMS